MKYDNDVVNAIQDSVRTERIVVGGEEFTTRPVFRLPKEPDKGHFDTLKLATLSSLVAYLEEVDALDHKNFFVHVESPTRVSVKTQSLDGAQEGDRRLPVVVIADLPNFNFDRYLSTEDMIIALNTGFTDAPDDHRLGLIRMLGNVVAAEAIRQKDDGISQQVVIEKGIERAYVDIPNPCLLTPIRTFHEAEQVTTPFLVRTKEERGQINAAIFQCDGGAWSNEARLNVKKYLDESLRARAIEIAVLA